MKIKKKAGHRNCNNALKSFLQDTRGLPVKIKTSDNLEAV